MKKKSNNSIERARQNCPNINNVTKGNKVVDKIFKTLVTKKKKKNGLGKRIDINTSNSSKELEKNIFKKSNHKQILQYLKLIF